MQLIVHSMGVVALDIGYGRMDVLVFPFLMSLYLGMVYGLLSVIVAFPGHNYPHVL